MGLGLGFGLSPVMRSPASSVSVRCGSQPARIASARARRCASEAEAAPSVAVASTRGILSSIEAESAVYSESRACK